MKNAMKILAFAAAFAAIGQSFYKAHADQAYSAHLRSLPAQQRVEILLQQKVGFDAVGKVLPVDRRRELSEALKDLAEELQQGDSIYEHKESPAI